MDRRRGRRVSERPQRPGRVRHTFTHVYYQGSGRAGLWKKSKLKKIGQIHMGVSAFKTD